VTLGAQKPPLTSVLPIPPVQVPDEDWHRMDGGLVGQLDPLRWGVLKQMVKQTGRKKALLATKGQV